jgi:hypothetical protein
LLIQIIHPSLRLYVTFCNKFIFFFSEGLGEWRKLHNEDHDLYSSPSIRIIKARRMRPLGRPRCRWLDYIRMGLVEVGWGDVDWIGLAQDRDRWRALVNSVLNLQVP